MKIAGVFEQGIAQAGHSPGDSISLAPNLLKVTIKCSSTSANNVYIGINQRASNMNVLQPGESATYYYEDRALTDKDGNGFRLYISFDPSGTDGYALVSAIYDTEKETECN